jgi:hypothetical protein
MNVAKSLLRLAVVVSSLGVVSTAQAPLRLTIVSPLDSQERRGLATCPANGNRSLSIPWLRIFAAN